MDWLSILSLFGVVVQALPAISAFMGIVWMAIRFYEWYRWRIIEKRHGEFK